METNAADTKESIDPRTRRAVTEGMAVDAHSHPKGSGKFDVYSASGSVYTVDLRADLRGERSCTCPDAEHNLSAGESCKHARRVRIMVGATDCPIALLDERDATLTANMRKFGAEPSIEQRAAQTVSAAETTGRAVATDGGEPR